VSDLSGKTALVTGASRGIGRAIAVALAKEGVDVAVNYLKRADEAEKTCSTIKDLGRKTIAIQADVSVSAEVAQMVESIERRLGSIHILVNNAGIAYRASLDNISEEDWDRVINVNLKSAFLVTQAVLPGMQNDHWGRIINIHQSQHKPAA